MMRNIIELIKELKQTQYQTDNHEAFEQCLATVFNELGLPARHLGGPNEPDIIIEFKGKKVTADAKTSRKNSKISEQEIGFPAQKRYSKKYNSYKSVVIAPSFRRGNVLTTANEESVILIETETICKVLYNHNISPYNSEEIFYMLFEGGKVMVTPEDIKSSLGKEHNAIVEIIKDLFAVLERKDIGKFTLGRIQDIFMGGGKDYEEETITRSLKLLLRLNILKEENQKYKLTRDIKEVLEDINILCLVRGVGINYKTPDNGHEHKGRRGRKLDHILEVIKLMKQGKKHPDAVREVATKFGVAYQTISDQCSRSLGFGSVDEFRKLYNERRLESYLKKKYPDDASAIERVFR